MFFLLTRVSAGFEHYVCPAVSRIGLLIKLLAVLLQNNNK